MKEEVLPYFVDFDNTLSDTKCVGDRWEMGEPIPYMIDAVNNASREREIVIFTARPVVEHEEVKRWLDEHGINYADITNIKKPAKKYIDDRNMMIDVFASIYGKRR